MEASGRKKMTKLLVRVSLFPQCEPNPSHRILSRKKKQAEIFPAGRTDGDSCQKLGAARYLRCGTRRVWRRDKWGSDLWAGQSARRRHASHRRTPRARSKLVRGGAPSSTALATRRPVDRSAAAACRLCPSPVI